MPFLGPRSDRQRIDAGATITEARIPGTGEIIARREALPTAMRPPPEPVKIPPLQAITPYKVPIEYSEQVIRREATGINTNRQGDFVAVRRGNRLVIMKQPGGTIYDQVGRQHGT